MFKHYLCLTLAVPLHIFHQNQQAKGQFNHGAILENKPIGFPQDRGELKPFSNILYWAHAWTPGDASLIGEHPHQGFEILSFVISGSLRHFDSKLKEWQELKPGDAQLIRAGSGITHAEQVNAKSSFFQVWFDPDLSISLSQPASYDIYPASTFKLAKRAGILLKIYTGKADGIRMATKGIEIYEILIENTSYSLPLERSKTRSLYVMEGTLKTGDNVLIQHDFGRFENEDTLLISANKSARIFVIDQLKNPEYLTYAARNGLS